MWIESDQVTEETLETGIQAELVKQPGRKILLKGDDRLTIGDVRKVMRRAQAAGAPSVGLGVEEKDKK